MAAVLWIMIVVVGRGRRRHGPKWRYAVGGGRRHVAHAVGLLGVAVQPVGLLDAVAKVAPEPVAGLWKKS